jgi:hypothetical protein
MRQTLSESREEIGICVSAAMNVESSVQTLRLLVVCSRTSDGTLSNIFGFRNRANRNYIKVMFNRIMFPDVCRFNKTLLMEDTPSPALVTSQGVSRRSLKGGFILIRVIIIINNENKFNTGITKWQLSWLTRTKCYHLDTTYSCTNGFSS